MPYSKKAKRAKNSAEDQAILAQFLNGHFVSVHRAIASLYLNIES